MSFVAPDGSPEQRPKLPLFMSVAFVPLGLLFFAALVFSLFTDNATYFGFSHARIIRILTLSIWALASLTLIGIPWLANRNSQPENSASGLIIIVPGLMLGFLMADTFDMIATQIDRAILFPFSSTKTWTNLDLPIAYTLVKNEKNGGYFIKVSAIPKELRITADDYHTMVTAQKAAAPEVATEWLAVANTYCARVTVQLSGQSGRVLHTGQFTLPIGTVHPCPALLDPMSERLPPTDLSGQSGFTFSSD